MLFPEPTDAQARDIVAQFLPDVFPIVLDRLENQDGFSGAVLWRVDTPGARWCLKAWPSRETPPERLTQIHDWMLQARRSGLDFVPAVHVTPREGLTYTQHAERTWDLTEWMRGSSRSAAGRAEVEGACTALARLHGVWASHRAARGPCPAIASRIERAELWMKLVASGWRIPSGSASADPLHRQAVRGWDLVCRHIDHVVDRLRPWLAQELDLHPCICDLRAEHVLFDGDRLSGIVDFGAARIDHAAVDLARLLGSLAGDLAEVRKAGLDRYRALRKLSLQEEALVDILDRSGAVLALASWLMWIYRDELAVSNHIGLAERLSRLIVRANSCGDALSPGPVP
jgi:homoserine kinase type II